MSAAPVRILLLQPPQGRGAVDLGSQAALARLGPEAQVEVAHDAAAAREQLLGGPGSARDFDLVVLDHDLGHPGLALVGALRTAGPPVVVVSAEGGEEVALAAFRAGAADCVAAGPDFAEVLPVVVLEQVRRLRAAREHRQAEQLAQKVDALERYNENIIQNMNSALLVVDADGRIVFANPTAEKILGAEAGGLRGRELWDWFPDSPRADLHIARTLAEAVRFRGAETLITRGDGQVVPIGISCSPLEDAGGAGQGAVAIFQDLSEIKQLQRQVLQTEKMASIGQLAAGVAHEINNPMGFIHANLVQMAEYVDELGRVWQRVEALRKALRGGDPGETEVAAEALGEIVQETEAAYLLEDCGKAVRESLEGAERIRHIVQDLRAFSHQDTDERVESDLNQCLDSTANIVWTMLKHSVVLSKDYAELPTVRCRPMQLKQVFMNLMINAYQAIETRARSEEFEAEIRLRTARRGRGVVVAVEDNGSGISPEHLNRIFDPFFTTKEVGVGMGLGLSTSFSIVRRHGGSLRVESEPGRGTRFEVVLPLDADAEGPLLSRDAV